MLLKNSSVFAAALMFVGQPLAVKAQSPTTQPAVIYLVQEGPGFWGRQAVNPFSGPTPTPVAADRIAQQYSVVIRIDSDADETPAYGYVPSIVGNDAQSAASLLTSTALMDPAVHQVLGLNADQRREHVVVNVYPSGMRLARLEVTLLRDAGAKSNFAGDASAKLAISLIERLRDAYAESSAAARKVADARRDAIQKQLDDAQSKADELRKKIQHVRDQTSTTTSRFSDPSMLLSNLKSQKRTAEAELNRNKAHLDAIDPGGGPLVKELEEVLKIREQQLREAKARPANNAISSDQLNELQAKVAEAKVQLTQAQMSSNSGMNSQFRVNEAATLRGTIAENEEHLKQLNEQIAKLEDPKFAAEAEQLPQMQNDEQRLQSTIAQLAGRRDQFRQSSRSQGEITITLLDGNSASSEGNEKR